MAKLVAVCRTKDYKFDRRQIPLVVDDSLTMVLQFNESCPGCEKLYVKQKELDRFVTKFNALSKDEISTALMVASKEVFNLLSQMMPCVGCRRSVEKLFNKLVESEYPALEPLIVTKNSELSIGKNCLFDPKSIFTIFYVHGTILNSFIDAIPKSRKNKRCVLHSLDSHKTKGLGTWEDVWSALSKECREEVVLIDDEQLMSTLENYLRKHRFCSDCKSKVLRAYSILIGEIDSSKEKGFCPSLYDGLRCCPQEKHIHIHCDTDFISRIIARAEPELTGRRERHAKTLDIAQEEVLTCLGIHLYDRLNKIGQKLRAEEQTWQILFCLGVESLKKSFEMALEKKQGISNLELLCEKLIEEDRVKEQKKEQKRQKRKKKKTKVTQSPPNEEVENVVDTCECDAHPDTSSNQSCTSCNSNSCPDHNANTKLDLPASCAQCKSHSITKDLGSKTSSNRSDPGYSSGQEGCENCSLPSSNDGSDIVCSEESCNHDGESSLCSSVELLDSCNECSSACRSDKHGEKRNSRQCMRDNNHLTPNGLLKHTKDYDMKFSLEDMLEASGSSDEDGDAGITEEEIQRFKANQKLLDSKRQELRVTLRERFDKLCQKCCCQDDCCTDSCIRKLTLNTD